MKKISSANKNRALHIAKSFIPKGNIKDYYKEICNGCTYKNVSECLECCYCQDGSYYEEDKLPEF